jgi:glycosyltransferase involved in cell wall biosynthesis
MRILQVSTADFVGGAEGSAWRLFQAYKKMGHNSWLAVGKKLSDDPDVFVIPNERERGNWARFWKKTGETIFPNERPFRVFRNSLQSFPGRPVQLIEKIQGKEDFDFPGTKKLLSLSSERPDILHCHNLHGKYFDLRELPALCRQLPVILNLRDTWLLSGHCAHSFDCERWKTGCGRCPDLSIYPQIMRDATSFNWQRKKEIFSRCRLFITAPSQWVMDRAEQSILAPSIIGKCVIPNGIDLTIFQPGNQVQARRELGFPENAKIIIFSANGVRSNKFKDFITMRKAIEILSKNIKYSPIIFLALGENAPDEQCGQATIHFIPYQKDPNIVARYYQAADILIHAARAETFANTVAEAKACGIPVVATATGGIPEQLRDGETGYLTPPGDPLAFATAIQCLLEDPDLRDKMGKAGIEDVRANYSLDLQVKRFLRWYKEILDNGI